MSTGIISNTAALSAQFNLSRADTESKASIYRLSSGNAIYQASDDVAGLAVGTILKTNVATQKTALSNTAQALSMLGVADGALANQGDIVQRIKALATQATSGSLSDTNRGYLNAELQNLVKENDRIASSTNFNGINLLDGSLFAPAAITTDTSSSATNASGSATIAAALTNGKSLFVNGVAITGRTNTAMTSGTAALNFDVTANTTTAQQASAIYNVIQNVLNYQGTDATTLAAKASLGQLSYSYTATSSTIGFTAEVAGTVGNGVASGTAFCVGSDTATAADVTVNGSNASNKTVSTSVGIGTGTATNVAVDGALNGGTFAASGTAYAGTARTVAQGNVTDSILKSLTTTAQATTGVDASQVSNNAAFVGNIISSGSGFQTSYVANNQVNVSITVGNYTYEARNVITNPAADTVVNFSSIQAGGGSFNLQLASGKGISNIVDQNSANVLSTRLNSALEGVSFYQNRNLTDYVGAGTVYATGGSSAIGDLAGSTFKMFNSDFDNLKVSNVKVSAPVVGATTPTITITVNGEDYVSGFDATGASSPLSTSISAGSYGLVSSTNPKNVLVFKNTATLDLSNSANAQGFQNALIKAFGINEGASGVSFQVGSNASDSIGIQIQSTNSSNIFLDANGNYSAIDISSLAGAQASAVVIDNAIQSITTTRANVGATQSRFNFAASNLNTAIFNQDAARGTYLDADISVESMKFAQSQVRLQASVSVLAQANQMPQNLLKLIG